MNTILIINPGSTSTKISVCREEAEVFCETLRHTAEELSPFGTICSQKDFRKALILRSLEEHGVELNSITAVAGRGGMLKPIESGTYEVNDDMVRDLKIGVQGQHASNLGGILAREIADPIRVPAYVVDPPVVDEMEKLARYSGTPKIERASSFHALNQKAVAKRFAAETRREYDSLNLLVAHMGGGVSVAAHRGGRVVDVNNALLGEGAFTPERTGSLPLMPLIEICCSGEYTKEEIVKMISGGGGMRAYTGTTDVAELEKRRAQGDALARDVLDAFAYQVAKQIGEMATVLCGRVDQIILTGGIANDLTLTDAISARVSWIAPVTRYPGEDEMSALAEGVLRVLRGQEAAKRYQ